MAGVEYQVTKVDPTDPHTKGAVYQVHNISEEVAATLGGKVYRARIIKDPAEPTVVGKVYQIILIDDPDDPAVKGKVYNAILTGGSEAVVVGPAVSPLLLDGAVAGVMGYVKAFGGAEQNGTPTPDAPVDIVCNNGALKVSPNLFDKNASYALFAGYINNTSVGESTTLTGYSGGDKIIIIKVAPNTTYTVTRATNLGSVYDRIRCAAFTTLPSSGSTGVILCNYMNTQQANATFTTLSDTQYVAINVRNSGAVGDDWTQFVDAFQLEQGSTATQYRPYGQIYTDGTVETIESHGKNLCDNNAFQSGYVNPNDGTINTNPQWLHTDYLYIGDAETYTYSLYTSVSGNAGRECAFYDKDKKFISGSATFITTNHVGEASKTFTVPEGAKYIRISVANLSESQKDTNIQLEQGSTPTEYEPYYNGGTATAEMLLKVGNYQDVQEILSGAVTRKIGVKVLDGTEDWTQGAASPTFKASLLVMDSEPKDSQDMLCSHFKPIKNNMTSAVNDNQCAMFTPGGEAGYDKLVIGKYDMPNLTAWKQWLADQYAAGTPVIVVYPLATATTESVAAQPMQTVDGDNVLEILQASIGDLELEAEYQKGAD